MHVKESVKDFVHDVKRRFSHHKHKRGESSSSTDTFDTSTTAFSSTSSGSDTTVYSTPRSHPATPAPSNPPTPAGSVRGTHGRSLPNTPEHANLVPFAPSQRVRTPSTPSRKHNVLHKLRRPQSGSLRSRTKSLTGLFGSKEDKDHPGLVPSALTLMHGGLAHVGRDHERRDAHEFLASDHASAQVQSSETIISDPVPASDANVTEPILEREMPNPGNQVSSTQGDREGGSFARKDAEDVIGEPTVVEEEEHAHIIPHSEVDMPCAEANLAEGTLSDPKGVDEEAVQDVHDDDSHSSHSEIDSPPTQTASLPETTSQTDMDAEETLSHSDVSETLVSTATDLDVDKDSHPALNSDSEDQTADQTSGAPLSVTTPVPTPSTCTVSVDPMSSVQHAEIPTVYEPVEEQIPGPDPFLDDSEDDRSASEEGASPPPQEIVLPPAPSSAPLNLSKPIPSLPQVPSRTVSSTPRPPASPVPAPSSPTPVYIPRLTAPSMFLPVPNTDPLSALLTKHVPPERRPRRDVVGEWAGRDIHEMVMSNSWRALAKMARDRIVKSDPEDLARILDLWSLRLSSLARLRLTNQASAECTNLFAVLNAVPVPHQHPLNAPGGPSEPSASPLLSPATNLNALPLSPASTLSQLPVPSSPAAQKTSLALPDHAPRSAAAQSQSRSVGSQLAHPFELTVFHARVHYWTGDVLGYVDALNGILGMCKEQARLEGWRVRQIRQERERLRGRDENEGEEAEGDGEEEDDEQETNDTDTDKEANDKEDETLALAEANLSMWLERTARVCLILASQLVEMKDYQAAVTLLTPLCMRRDRTTDRPTPSPALYSALGRIYLIAGNVAKATECFETAASCSALHNTEGGSSGRTTSEGERQKPHTTEIANETIAMNDALLSAALGNWEKAEEALREILRGEPENFTAMNNLAVALFGQGRITEGIDLLEAALRISPSTVVVAEPFLFNLSTLYELRSATAIDNKRELLTEVAKWSGDGLKTTCLKMPSN